MSADETADNARFGDLPPRVEDGWSSSQQCARLPRSLWSWPSIFCCPLDGGTNVEKIGKLALGAWRSRRSSFGRSARIIRSNHPVGRAVEALAFSVPLYMLLFATTYFRDGPTRIKPRSGRLSAAPTPCTSLPPCSRPSASGTSPPRAKLHAWWSPCRCGWTWCSWVWWCRGERCQIQSAAPSSLIQGRNSA